METPNNEVARDRLTLRMAFTTGSTRTKTPFRHAIHSTDNHVHEASEYIRFKKLQTRNRDYVKN